MMSAIAIQRHADWKAWIALDSVTKMVLSYHLGRREGDSADAFVRDLSIRIEGRFQLTTDGLRWYIPTADKHLGGNVDYAQLLKCASSNHFSEFPYRP